MAQADPTTTRKFVRMAAGQRYGQLVAIEFANRDARGNARWRFRCDCGRECVKRITHVRAGRYSTCGCTADGKAGSDRVYHGMYGTPEYRAWNDMLRRCNNPKHQNFSYYGGRGIIVCERWRSFTEFFADMGLRTSPKHSIDRIDNDGNYEPGNCRWATVLEQARNRRPKSRRLAKSPKAA